MFRRFVSTFVLLLVVALIAGNPLMAEEPLLPNCSNGDGGTELPLSYDCQVTEDHTPVGNQRSPSDSGVARPSNPSIALIKQVVLLPWNVRSIFSFLIPFEVAI